MHRREAVISAALPASPRFPRLLATYDDGHWVALAFEAVEGRPPHHPWDPARARGGRGGPVRPARGRSRRARCRRSNPSPSTPGGSSAAGARSPRRRRPAGASTPGQPCTWTGWPSWSRAGPRPARVRTLVHGDVRADNVLVAGERGGVRGLAPRLGGEPRLRRRRLGALGRSRGRPAARGAAGPLRAVAPGRSRRGHGPARGDQRLLRVALPRTAAAGAADTATPSKPPRARWRWPGCGAARVGDARRGAPGAPVGSAPCASDCRSPTSPRTSRPAPSSTASSTWRRRPRRSGFDSVWVMDHFYQLPPMGGPSQPMLDAYTLLGALAARTATGAARRHGDGRHLPQPGASGEDRHHPRRDQLRARHPRHRSGLVRRRARRVGLRLPAGPGAPRPPGGGAADLPCDVHRGGAELRRAATTASTRRGTCRRPSQPGGPPILVGGGGEKRTLQLVARYADMANICRRRRPRSPTRSTCCEGTARRSDVTPPR